MPELPEVETVRQTILPSVTGRQIDMISPLTPGVYLSGGLDASGSIITDVRRRGKYLLLDLISQDGLHGPLIMLVHLRMTGRLLLRERDETPPRHTHLRLRLTRPDQPDNPIWLDFHDTRRFGRVWLLTADPEGRPVGAPGGYDALGPEPLGPEFSAAWLQGLRDKRKNTSLKAFLLDQTVIAGLGNIYADESLFAAKLAPDQSVGTVSDTQFSQLADAVRQVLADAVSCQGTSLRDYVDGWNRKGRFQDCLMAYGRAGQPCRICGTIMRKMKLAGRTTCWCPDCQSS